MMVLSENATREQAQAWNLGFDTGRRMHGAYRSAMAESIYDCGAQEEIMCSIEHVRDSHGRTFSIALQGWFFEGFDTGWDRAFEANTSA